MSRFPLAWVVLAPLSLVLALAGCQKQPSSPLVVPSAPSASERLAAGRQAFAAGDCARALPALTEAAELAPQSAEAHLYLGLCAARQNDLGRAETELGRAAAADPKDPRPLEALGLLQYGRDRRDEAKRTLAEAAARGSTNAQTFYYQGNLAMFAGDCREALADYRRAMALDPSYAPAAAEYRAARVACARVETAGTPAPLPTPKPASKLAPSPAKPALKPVATPTPASAPALVQPQ